MKRTLGGVGVFVRSSTNAEDLDGFNGAGLYDTVANVRGKKALGEAVLKVWASVWVVGHQHPGRGGVDPDLDDEDNPEDDTRASRSTRSGSWGSGSS